MLAYPRAPPAARCDTRRAPAHHGRRRSAKAPEYVASHPRVEGLTTCWTAREGRPADWMSSGRVRALCGAGRRRREPARLKPGRGRADLTGEPTTRPLVSPP